MARQQVRRQWASSGERSSGSDGGGRARGPSVSGCARPRRPGPRRARQTPAPSSTPVRAAVICANGDSARHLQPGQAAPFRVASVLGQLADADFLCLDHTGQITAAYPFSALPTPHRVQIAGHATVFAMCAIDALGISAMTGVPVVIESADPSTGQPITLNVDGASSTWDPGTAVVYVGPHRRRLRRAVGIGVLRVHELLRRPRSGGGVGSLPPRDHRRHPGTGPCPARRHRHLRPSAQLA